MRVGLVDLWFEQLVDEREEDFAEDLGPFGVVWRGEVWSLQAALQRGEGVLADFATWVDALRCEAAEDGRPVSFPSLVSL